ncbi:MAG: amino acid ABC transporter substrate-binding protein [Nocardioidaceae bacterium]|nr:amino acid ABC transporter substrate-binding protein [Nocardioidaceae bacterium]NUS51484.1 amino acid ABC transporter substrate-binding protein [Nocardioidaceae bacterium]
MTSLAPARRTACALGALLLATLAAGCAATGSDTSSADTRPRVVKPGALTVCTDMPYQPFESMKDGKPVGFDVDLVRKVADDLGVQLRVKDTDFDAIQSGDALNSDKCDVAISAMTITGERARVLDFSSPYFDAAQALVVDKGSNVTSLDDLAGQKIAVQGGTTGELYVTDNAPSSAQVVPLEDATAMQDALDKGKVDAAVYDNTVVGDVVAANPGLAVVAQFDTGEQYGMAVKKDGNVDLLRTINRVLASLDKDGGYDKIFNTWFGTA